MQPKLSAPAYWAEATAHLAGADEVMAGLIARYPRDVLHPSGEPFPTLLNAIVGQQISTRAAVAIWNRLKALGPVEPEALLAVDDEALRAVGLSRQKMTYVRSLAQFFADPTHDPARWPGMTDGEIIAELSGIRGIGVWTAEMFMIFHLNRPDVWPVLDLGLIRALQRHYGIGEKPARRELAAFGERFRPYRTVATWYLWRSIDPEPVRY